MYYYIGIDGGGSKTFVRVMNKRKETIDTLVTSGSNISSIGYKKTERVLREGINTILSHNKLLIQDCKGLCMGAAGVDREKEKKEVRNIFKNIGFKNIKIMNDTRIVLKTVTDQKEGIVVIAGTGSIVLGISKEKEFRAGGWGYKLGDEGSAYWIGMKGIKAVLDAYDQVERPTKLSKIILNHFDIENPKDFIELFYKKEIKKNEIAEISILVDQVAIENDSVAIKILNESSHALGKQIIAVYKRLFNDTNIRVPLILNGSVVLNSKIFKRALGEYLKNNLDNFDIQPIKRDPSFGACKFSMELD